MTHPADTHDLIRVQGARENNLKGIDLEIPKRRLTVFSRLIDETYSTFGQRFMPTLPRPDADWIIDLGPGAGQDGGTVVFEETPADLVSDASRLTGQHLAEYVAA